MEKWSLLLDSSFILSLNSYLTYILDQSLCMHWEYSHKQNRPGHCSHGVHHYWGNKIINKISFQHRIPPHKGSKGIIEQAINQNTMHIMGNLLKRLQRQEKTLLIYIAECIQYTKFIFSDKIANFCYLYDWRWVLPFEVTCSLNLGLYPPRKLRDSMLYSLMITFQRDDSRVLMEIFLSCETSKRLI